MRKILIAAVSLVLVVSLFFVLQDGTDLEERVVTRVIDGDTIVVEGGERVRLLGIDSQEQGEPCYDDAKQRLEKFVLKEEVVLEGDERGGYGRRLSYVFLDGTLINAQLVKEGLAVAYFYEEDNRYRDRIQAAEQEAMENSRGCEWG